MKSDKRRVIDQEELISTGVKVMYKSLSKESLELEVRLGQKTYRRVFSVHQSSDGAFADFWWSFLQGNLSVSAVPNSKQLNAVDLFCATGALSLGVGTAGGFLGTNLVSKLAVDVDLRALEVYKHHNRFAELFAGSVEELVDYQVRGMGDSARFAYHPELTEIGLRKSPKTVDVVLAGPPCQGHSTMNVKTRHNDPRNKLYLAAVAYAVAANVTTVIIENVPGVLKDNNSVVSSAIRLLSDAGYHVMTDVFSADQLGWPQTRKRFFLIASKIHFDVGTSEFKLAVRRDNLPLSWAIGDLEILPQDNVMNSTPELSSKNQERIEFLHKQGVRNLPLHLRPKSHQDGTSFMTVYGRLEWEKPSGTITTGFLSPGRGRYVHPTQVRALSPLEASRIQGFPNEYFPLGKLVPEIRRYELAKWIGDAVPPILGFYVGLLALSPHS
jgi:DNA (cytosine-5)-methyltransferase 1